MTTSETKNFEEALEILQKAYPHRSIKMYWDIDRYIVSIDGKDKFTTLEYNYLYNMTRLVNLLEDELL